MSEKIELIRTIYEALGKRILSPTTIRSIVQCFEEVTVEELREAVPVILREYSELPSVAELVDAIKSGHVRKIRVKEVKRDWSETLRALDQAELGVSDSQYDELSSEEGYEMPGEER